MTSAPASRRTRGASVDAAPSAQSTTTFSGPSGVFIAPSRWRRSPRPSRPVPERQPQPSHLGAGRAVGGRGGHVAPRCGPRRRQASLNPPLPKILIPLSGIALWLAESTMPRSAPLAATACATAGVGTTPSWTTSAPALASPAETAASSSSPEGRVSRPTTTVGRATGSAGHGAHADGQRQLRRQLDIGQPPDTIGAEQARHLWPAGNHSATGHRGGRSPLAVLRCLAGLLQAVLLALLDPGVAGEEAGLLQAGRWSSSMAMRARAMPRRSAPACPDVPPPRRVASTS